MSKTRCLFVFAALLLGLTVLGGPGVLAAQSTPEGEDSGETITYEIPGDEVYPEGVAFDETTRDFFVGSTTDGTIYRGNVNEEGELEVFSEGGADGRTTAVGMKIDPEGRLFVAGGSTGLVSVYDTATGNLLGQFDNGLAPDTFLNDITIDTQGNAYITDSVNPSIFLIPSGTFAVEEPAEGTPAATPDPDATPVAVTGELTVGIDLTDSPIEFEADFNLNGIAISAGGNFLLTVHSGTGQLFRIDLATGAITEVDLGGAELTNGDGLVLDQDTLFVVRNQDELITRIDMNYSLETGEVVDEITDETFNFPTTAAKTDGRLLVVNSQFGAREGGEPDLPFTVSSVAIPQVPAGGTDTDTEEATPDS